MHLCNTLTALTLDGVPLANTTREEVIESLGEVLTITSQQTRASVEFTLRPRN